MLIFDLDGTLVDNAHILRDFGPGKSEDYDLFHRLTAPCWPNRRVAQALWTARGMEDVFIMTARSERYKELTERWLEKHHFEYSKMLMRPLDDERGDVPCKSDLLDQVLQVHGWREDQIHAYEDHPGMVELYRQRGIMTTVVPGYGT